MAEPLHVCLTPCHHCRVRLARHRVDFAAKDTGARLCCSCMDALMANLSHEETANGGDGPAGLRSFRTQHEAECRFVPVGSQP